MTLTAPPTAPVTTDPSTFASRADALVAWLATHVTEENALITAQAGSYTGTSATSLTPSVASKSLTASTGLAYQVGQPVMIASASTPAVFMSGPVTAYNSTTGAMTVNVTSIGTASARTDWVISLVPAGYTPGQIVGTATNDDATAGNIGEVLATSVAAGSAVSLSDNVAANITSVSLTAGDWDVWGNFITIPAGGALTQSLEVSINTTSATQATAPNGGAYYKTLPRQVSNADAISGPVGQKALSLSVTTTVYLVTTVGYTGGTMKVYGSINARRAR
jgi:hypothetical protein